MLSFKINGKLASFFLVVEGLDNGPLSPLLFFLAKEVLSTGISHLISSKEMLPMASL